MSLSYAQLSTLLDKELSYAKGLRDDNNLLHELLDERDDIIEHLKLIIKSKELN